MALCTMVSIYYNNNTEYNITQTKEPTKYPNCSNYITTSCETVRVEMICVLSSQKGGRAGKVPCTIESS